MTEEEKAKKEDERKRLLESAKHLIESGMEPTQVGQMLLGLTPTGTPPTVAQGMGVDDVLKIVNLVVGKKEADELRGLISSLDKKLDDLAKSGAGKKEESKPVDPITFARQQAEAMVAWNKAIKELTPERPPVTEKGEPLEIVKERNRHEERMEEVKGEQRYKEKISETVAEIPERIGRGIAGQISEGEGESGSGAGELEYLMCTEEGCGTKIPITPETGEQVTCPKCGSIYSRKETIAPGKE